VFLVTEMCICPTTFAGMVHYGVFCKKQAITKGTRYGPFKGKVVNTSEIKSFDDNSYMWEVSSSFIMYLSYRHVFEERVLVNIMVTHMLEVSFFF